MGMAKNKLSMKASTFIHRTAFAVALSVYIAGCWMLAMRRPDIVQTIARHPLHWRTIALVASVIAVGVLLWPITGWLARHTVGSREIKIR